MTISNLISTKVAASNAIMKCQFVCKLAARLPDAIGNLTVDIAAEARWIEHETECAAANLDAILSISTGLLRSPSPDTAVPESHRIPEIAAHYKVAYAQVNRVVHRLEELRARVAHDAELRTGQAHFLRASVARGNEAQRENALAALLRATEARGRSCRVQELCDPIEKIKETMADLDPMITNGLMVAYETEQSVHAG